MYVCGEDTDNTNSHKEHTELYVWHTLYSLLLVSAASKKTTTQLTQTHSLILARGWETSVVIERERKRKCWEMRERTHIQPARTLKKPTREEATSASASSDSILRETSSVISFFSFFHFLSLWLAFLCETHTDSGTGRDYIHLHCHGREGPVGWN